MKKVGKPKVRGKSRRYTSESVTKQNANVKKQREIGYKGPEPVKENEKSERGAKPIAGNQGVNTR